MSKTEKIKSMSFGEHLDVLRLSAMKIALVTIISGIIAFIFKEELFSIILSPKNDEFVIYKLFRSINNWIIPGEDVRHKLLVIQFFL